MEIRTNKKLSKVGDDEMKTFRIADDNGTKSQKISSTQDVEAVQTKNVFSEFQRRHLNKMIIFSFRKISLN